MRLPASVSIGISETIQSAIDAETAAQERQIAQLMEVIAGKNVEIDDLKDRLSSAQIVMRQDDRRLDRRGNEIDEYRRILLKTEAEVGKSLEKIRSETDGALDGAELFEAVCVLISQRDNARNEAAQYRGDSLKYKTIAPKLADCEKALERVENEAKELRAVLQRIADYDAPDAHAMIEQARAILTKYPARG
jgi:chromosome segregation ATPase